MVIVKKSSLQKSVKIPGKKAVRDSLLGKVAGPKLAFLQERNFFARVSKKFSEILPSNYFVEHPREAAS